MMSSIYSYPFIEETVKRKEILKASTSKEIVISINNQHAFAQELINIDAEAYTASALQLRAFCFKDSSTKAFG